MRAAISIFLICVFIPCSIAKAQDENSLRFATLGLTPYAYKDQNGNYTGYHYEVINRILEKAGMPVINHVRSTKRILAELERGRIDCSLMIRTPKTETTFWPIEAIGKSLRVGVVARKGTDLNTYEDLKSLIIAVPIGTTARADFDNDPGIQKLIVPDYAESAKVFQRGRVDAMFGAIDSLIFNLNQIGSSSGELGKPFIFQNYPLWVFCSRSLPVRDPRLVLLKEAIRDLRETGEISAIIQQHIGS